MNLKQRTTIIILLLLLSLAILACGLTKCLPQLSHRQQTNTLMPPTATSTSTSIPPTPTITAIPGSKEPVVIGDFKLSISSVDLSDHGFNGLVPSSLTANETVLIVQITLISGDLKNLSLLHVWVIDEQGNRTNSGTTLSVDSEKQVIWLFPVAKEARSFFLYFPTGEVIDLAPLLPSSASTSVTTPSGTATPALSSTPHSLERHTYHGRSHQRPGKRGRLRILHNSVSSRNHYLLQTRDGSAGMEPRSRPYTAHVYQGRCVSSYHDHSLW